MQENNIHLHVSFLKGSLIIEGLYHRKKNTVGCGHHEQRAVLCSAPVSLILSLLQYCPITGSMVKKGAEIWRGFKERPQLMSGPEGKLQCEVAYRLLHRTNFSIS